MPTDATTLPPATRPANPVARTTLAKTAKANARTAPKPDAPPAGPKAAPIVRIIEPGQKLDPDAKVTVLVDNPKVRGNKNWRRWEAGYPVKGASIAVKDILATSGGPTVGDIKYDFERRFLELDPAPRYKVK